MSTASFNGLLIISVIALKVGCPVCDADPGHLHT